MISALSGHYGPWSALDRADWAMRNPALEDNQVATLRVAEGFEHIKGKVGHATADGILPFLDLGCRELPRPQRVDLKKLDEVCGARLVGQE